MSAERSGVRRRRNRWGPLCVLTTAALLLTPVEVAAAAPPTKDVAATLVHSVPDERVAHDGKTYSTYSMGGLEIVGTDAFLTKNGPGADDESWATFYHINDFGSADATIGSHTVTAQGSDAPADLGHVNGMTYYRKPDVDPIKVGSFYIPMIKSAGSSQVAQVNNQGKITAQFKARQGSTDKKIASIAYRGDDTFIVGTAAENKTDPDDGSVILKPYYTARIKGDYFELGDKFYVPTTETYDVGQDIDYDTKTDELLVPVWDGKNTVGTATGRRNRVIVTELGTIKDGHVYAPTRWIDQEGPKSEVSKFEVEGICRDDSGKLYVGSNILGTDGSTGIDGVHQLTNTKK